MFLQREEKSLETHTLTISWQTNSGKLCCKRCHGYGNAEKGRMKRKYSTLLRDMIRDKLRDMEGYQDI